MTAESLKFYETEILISADDFLKIATDASSLDNKQAWQFIRDVLHSHKINHAGIYQQKLWDISRRVKNGKLTKKDSASLLRLGIKHGLIES